ncbi:hypothetical protein IF650_10580 [Cellulosimicrobium terreum]|nr:hypothetical protein [Cellulosimicrobium terreum]
MFLAREHPPGTPGQALRDGTWERVRRGAYRTRTAPSSSRPASERELAVDRARALGRQLGTEHSLSHTTAALLHGFRLWRTPVVTHVVQSYNASSRSARDVARHRLPLEPGDLGRVGGLRVTAPARTVADCLRLLPALDGLVLADSALAAGVRRADVLAVLDRALPGARGARRARHVIRLADAGAESAWESWLRYVVLRTGLPRPTTQLQVVTSVGRVRADVGWERWRLLLEFDGLVKYRTSGDGIAPAADPGRVLVQEKRRQEALERERWRVLRFMASDSAAYVEAQVLRRMPPDVVRSSRPDPLLPPLPRTGTRRDR